MAVIEGRGRTVEEAITDALARTGLKRAQVEVTVVSEGKAKMLGLIGGEDAVVEITPKIQPLGDVSPEVKSYIEDSVNKLISLAELDVTVDAFDDEGTLFVEINGADSALVIGRYGDTLSAIQTIVRAIAFRKFSQKLSIVIDSEGYLKLHEDKLRDFAIRTAKEAQRNGEPIELEPMNARGFALQEIAPKPSVVCFVPNRSKARRVPNQNVHIAANFSNSGVIESTPNCFFTNNEWSFFVRSCGF